MNLLSDSLQSGQEVWRLFGFLSRDRSGFQGISKRGGLQGYRAGREKGRILLVLGNVARPTGLEPVTF
ncbi:MAG: hypothetical protein KJ072_16310 [Verrucomicrobia bacterium]|nr:hypothetical protein [Verrucomicrobiota bacterium]